MKKLYLLATVFLFSSAGAQVNLSNLCAPPDSKVDLDINNVRANMLNAGDMWWDLSQARYEVPKGGRANAIFNGALWIGGLSPGGQLKVAAMTYRQNGVDFWPGPLDSSAQISSETCWQYDKIWKANRAEVEAFVVNRFTPGYIIPDFIRTWPGNGNVALGEARNLAPFSDVDGDGIYDPTKGDYPGFSPDPNNNQCDYHLQGDQALWWVFNDRGNTHEVTGSASIGIEVQAMAYAFNRNDDLGNTTFYRYHLINRSSEALTQCWMGWHTVAGLGDAFDDYVGCDVQRNVSYVYNGRANDGGQVNAAIGTYGSHAPALGIDVLRGPLADANDLVDNDRDGLTDEGDEHLHLERFVSYDNEYTYVGIPETQTDYYNYLRGLWKDGTPITYGAHGYGGSQATWFMYPGNSDPNGWGTNGIPQANWSEVTENNSPYDRYMISTVGPFTIEPGQVQTVHTSVVWARDPNGNHLSSRDTMLVATDRVQQVFESCFSNLPCTTEGNPRIFTQQDKGSVWFALQAGGGAVYWDFGDGTNSNTRHPHHTYTRAGKYIVSASVSNVCGTKAGIDTVEILDAQEVVYGPVLHRLEGSGGGGMNLDFMQESIDSILRFPEARVMQPYYAPVAAPVKVIVDPSGANFTEGDFKIALDTIGATARWKIWKTNSTDTVYSDTTLEANERQYIPQWGISIEAKEVNLPGKVENNNGLIEATMSFSDAQKNWLTGLADDDSPTSNNWIRSGKRDAFGSTPCDAAFNAYRLGITFIDPNEVYQQMLGGTWAPYRLCAKMISPTYTTACYTAGAAYYNDPTFALNKMSNLASVNVVFTTDRSKWSRCPVIETGPNPSLNEGQGMSFVLRQHASVDQDGKTVAQGGLSDPTNPMAADYIGATGMGWFPGYAYNLETGERLNLVFGENSALTTENGRDMLWNPTANTSTSFGDPLWGGMHYIYVLGHNGDAYYPTSYSTADLQNELRDIPRYDAGYVAWKMLSSSGAIVERTEVFRDAMWVNIPLLAPGHSLLESEATIRLRVTKPFTQALCGPVALNDTNPLFAFTLRRSDYPFLPHQGELVVYPNPFVDECTITFENPEDQRVRLRLYDIRGRLVRDQPNLRTDRITIDRRGLENGVYIFRLEFENGETKTGRIIAR